VALKRQPPTYCVCARPRSEPYIRDWTLDSIFGAAKNDVAARFLIPLGGGAYDLKPEFCTERKILKALPGDSNKTLRSKLYQLVCNVCLIYVGNDCFVPRIEIELTRWVRMRVPAVDGVPAAPRVCWLRCAWHMTALVSPPTAPCSSFQELDDHVKNTLKRLYVSYFFERQEDLWTRGAMRKLPALKAASGAFAGRERAAECFCVCALHSSSRWLLLVTLPSRHACVR